MPIAINGSETDRLMPPIYRGDQIKELPEPEWLLPDFIQERGITLIAAGWAGIAGH